MHYHFIHLAIQVDLKITQKRQVVADGFVGVEVKTLISNWILNTE